ncbi:hypothetical protein MVES1_003255 [Malassezia vespertilionis]|uniref:Proteasome assembly chaperone 1 n=1 Tax=Malassezia vespertilionis TaxID=2020962 RepID=A0A2N1J9D0_9BASI|nr:uncharacterized protein MVES1_003255 [Malassezia vespertilionis]PKI83158.1 hypothetical protein MVES_003092 [Malassezia vespertilionis]WFD07887.1 hypothetical protein MVES1_003255 [Malassezia vespertilionis]
MEHGVEAAPRHAVESDEEEVGVNVHAAVRLDVDARGRRLVVLGGDAGVSVLAFANGAAAWEVLGDIAVDGECVGWITAPSADVLLAYIPQPAWLALGAEAPLARRLVEIAAPSSVVVVQDYAPARYIAHALPAEAPLRFLRHVPASATMPHAWASFTTPWEVPNLCTGVAAAVYAEAIYAHVPALCVYVPTAQLAPHDAMPRTRRAAIPLALQTLSVDEARRKLQRIAASEEAHLRVLVALLGKENGAREAQTPLLLRAAQAILAVPSANMAGVGDGAMHM